MIIRPFLHIHAEKTPKDTDTMASLIPKKQTKKREALQ
jgi:hypothetical protein